MRFRKTISILLVLALLMGIFAGCSESGENSDETTPHSADVLEPGETEPPEPEPENEAEARAKVP
ncbi:MAG: carbohydrate ABC transporter substrate-binding protein, partial [Clostridia bacterium]|nr:carbohydrate ABC transporter substrate-binding protein [Clostridia bacterium]